MTKLKLASKMHIMIIVSAIIVAIGIAVGVVCQFIAGGYFNYGAEYTSYDTVVVEYALLDYYDKDDVKEICDKAFKAEGVSYSNAVYGDTGEGGRYTFQFSASVNAEKIQSAANAINTALNGSDATTLSNAYYHEAQTLLGGANPLKFAAIAISAAAAFQFLYFVIRFKLTMALSALLADVHNLAIFVSLLAITRVPVGSSVAVFGVLTVLLTMIGCGLLFDNMRKNLKEEGFAKLDTFEQTDICAGESLANVCTASVITCAAAVIILVLLAISALSVSVIVTPVVLAVLSCVSAVYGTAFFTPSVYSRFKKIGDNYKASKKAAKK